MLAGMEYRQLGNCGLRVSTVTLGTRGFGATRWSSPVGHIDAEGARRQVKLARDAGVNLFDTADVYSNGVSEEYLGRALGKDRDEVLVATKARLPIGDGPNDAASGVTTSCARPRRAFAAWAPITSTSTRCTGGTGRPASRRP